MKIKLNGKPWEVQAVDSISTEGIIEVALKETYQNSIQEAVDEENKIDYVEILKAKEYHPITDTADVDDETIVDNTAVKVTQSKEPKPEPEKPDQALPHIKGDAIVYPYDTREYFTVNMEDGIWEVSNSKKAIIQEQTSTYAKLYIATTYSGEVDLIYKRTSGENIVFKITIQSL